MQKNNNSLDTVYHNMLNESKDKMVIGDAPLQQGGPQEKGGFKQAVIDKRNKKLDKDKENAYKVDELSNDDNLEEDEEEGASKKKQNKAVEKLAEQSLNKFMAKSTFDRLYENVMGPDLSGDSGAGAPDAGMDDLDAEGLGLEDEGESDEVTFTLDRATAQKFCDALHAVLDTAEEDPLDDEGADLGAEGGEEGGDEWYDEDEETGAPKAAGKSVDNGKNNKVGNYKPASGATFQKPTDKVGNDGDHGHALNGAKKPNMADKSNKVGNYTTGKRLFDK